ncbi:MULTISPECIES: hypothetical protein [unclassified Frankia]|uniref:hypothetical protein n=1 Tax=unclassified Frankia TaxID=2632575 RepID=UPI002AD4ED12|nr:MULTISPECIES: hypothetical protein [unclassified Frankia]
MTQLMPDGDIDSVDVGYINTYGSPLEQSESLDSDGLGSTDRGHDPLDDGWDPPDRFGPGERFGTTAAEQRAGESLDSLLSQEQPDPDPYAEAARLESGDVLESDVYAPYDPPGGRGLEADGVADASPPLLADDEGVRNVTTGELIAHGPIGGRCRGREDSPYVGAPEEEAVRVHDEE